MICARTGAPADVTSGGHRQGWGQQQRVVGKSKAVEAQGSKAETWMQPQGWVGMEVVARGGPGAPTLPAPRFQPGYGLESAAFPFCCLTQSCLVAE